MNSSIEFYEKHDHNHIEWKILRTLNTSGKTQILEFKVLKIEMNSRFQDYEVRSCTRDY